MQGQDWLHSPPSERAVPLCSLTLSLVDLGLTTSNLLESSIGGLVSCLQYRRRLLSVLDCVYSERRAGSRTAASALSSRLKNQLLLASVLLSQADMDLRAEAAPMVSASDASSDLEAGACCEVPLLASRELFRHTLSKGLWNCLLASYPSLLREKACLDPSEELPGIGEGYSSHPLYEEITCSMFFRPFGKITKVRRRRHINLGEVRADCCYVHLQDSQVSLAAMSKGRSSSKAINLELQRF